MAAIKQPADKSHFILPDLGEGVHEAELIKWRVKPGETVAEHQTLAEMETDKALVEVPSPWAGTIKELNGAEGEIINVGSVLVTYDVGTGSAKPAAKAAPKSATATNGSAEHADAKSEDAGTVVGSVSDTLKVSSALTSRRPEAETSARAGKALATPAVRRVARELEVDIDQVPGTGRGGRVTASDVEGYARGGAGRGGAPTAPAAPRAYDLPPVSVSGDGVAERIPFRGVRRKIAESLDRSVRTAVHFTATDEADVTALDAKRREYGRVMGRKLSFLPFVMLAVTRALRKHPTINANVDDANGEILVKSVVNLGCAVDTDHGLMVPVIHAAERMGLAQLADSVGALANACRNRTIERERLTGGTFTISNVGSYGAMFATPIINYPEVGILAVGRVKERVLTRDGMFYAGKVMPLSMSCDHRVVDGAECARFINTLSRMLENPELLFND